MGTDELHRRDARFVGLMSEAVELWTLMAREADRAGVYSRGLAHAAAVAGVTSERTLYRHLSALRDRGLVEPLPRIPGQVRRYRVLT
jgi:DNA-binding transcriptional ArsR family regulator